MVPSAIPAPEACGGGGRGGGGNGEEMKWLTASLELLGKVETMSKAYTRGGGGRGVQGYNP